MRAAGAGLWAAGRAGSRALSASSSVVSFATRTGVAAFGAVWALGGRASQDRRRVTGAAVGEPFPTSQLVGFGWPLIKVVDGFSAASGTTSSKCPFINSSSVSAKSSSFDELQPIVTGAALRGCPL